MKKEEKLADKVEQEIETEFDKLVESGELRKKIDEEIDKDIEEEVQTEVKERIGTEFPPRGPLPQIQSSINQAFSGFRQSLILCWRGVCRYISLITLIAYLLIGVVITLCFVTSLPICLSRSITGGLNYIVILGLIALLVSLLLSLFSTTRREAIIFTIILDIPIIIAILLTTLRYIGIVIIVFAILSQIAQNARGE